MRAQLFMSGVKFTDKAEDVKIALAHILHGPPFPLDGKLNFHVRLFYSRGGTHSGTGLVTFPHADFAGTFLALYPTVTISGRQVRFIQNRKEDDRALVDKVASTPWEDPERVRRQRQAIVESSSSISLSAASFGRFCPDGVFSAEVDVIDATIACDAGKRHLRLDGSADDFESTADYFSPSFASIMAALDIEGPDHSAYYRPSSIIAIADSSTTHIARVFIEANQPPTFVRSVTNGFTHKVDETRLSSLEGCRREMPPVSRGLCLTFHSPGELAIFIHRSKMLHLPHPITKPIPVEYRDLYAPQAVAGLDGFLAQLPFPLAFELNKSVLSGMLTPVNVYRDLKQAILTLLAEEPENAAPIFRSFVSSLRTPGIEAIKIPPVKSRRRRRRTPRRTAATLSEKLAHVTADYFSGPDQPTGRLSFRANNTNTAVCLSYHLRITPSARFLEGPLPDQSNSVLRRFGNHECFLRVTFQEESGSKLRQEGGSTHELLRDRYRPYLVNGVKVAGRHYDFLGYSMSGLKEYAFTFSRPFVFEGKLMDASDIRSSLGDFSAIDKKPALLAARWSQAFSASAPSVTLNPDSIQSIPDRDALDGSCFTDGVGTISLNLAQDVQNALRYHRRRARHTNEPPSALQIRFGGAKGVLVVDPRLYGRVVCLRESQTKFKGTGRTLDIATTSARPILTYLNRPLIVLLEHHGVNGNYIKQLQDLMVEEVTSILRGFDSAAAILTQNGLGTSFGLPSLLRHLHSILGIRHHLDLQHPSGLDHQLIFTSLHYAETHILREIKHRAHIRVPGSYTLIGVADEWDCLNEGEIYATVVDEENEVHEDIVGKVLITRSPQIHPGDAQMVTAVRRPQLAHLRNVVVFPCRGGRSLPSMLGGGDLDGDIYNLIVDPNLHPPSGRTSEAGAYTPLDKKETTNPCTLQDVADFVIDFINSDLLGAISIRHLRISDIKGAGCEDCIKLAELASHAVDFPKTGTPVNFRDVPDVPSVAKPDFLSGDNPSGEFYKSKKILGELYRNVPDEKFHPDQSRKHITDGQTIIGAIRRLELDELGLPSMDTPPNEEILADVGDLLTEYSTHLLQIAKAHIASTKESDHISEAEMVSGTIQARWSDPRKRREAVIAMNIQTQELSAGIRRELCYAQQPNGDEDEEDMYDLDDLGLESQREAFTRAYAAWVVAEEALEDDHGAFGPASFGLLALGILLELIKARMKARHA